MEATKLEVHAMASDEATEERITEQQAVIRELADLEMMLVGGGTGIVVFS